MDITLAKQLLTTAITANSNDAIALNLALSILENTYSADFTALETAKAEADKATSYLSAANEKITELQTSLETANTALTTEQEAHATDNTNNEATISSLNDQITTLKTQVANLTPTP